MYCFFVWFKHFSKNWIKRWNDYVNSPIVNLDINTLKFIEPNLFNDVFEILETKTIRNKNIQPGGTSNALKYLKSFLDFRVKNYM